MAWIAFLVIIWLPGAVIFRLPWLRHDRRAALAADERLFWAVMISVAVSLSAGLALAALHRYSFERLLVCNVAVALGAAVLGRGRLRLGSSAPRPGLSALIPIALIALSVWRFFPPSEYITAGKDPGTYFNEGIQIAQRGSIVTVDQTVASIPPSLRDLFFPSHETPNYYSTRFVGFFIRDPDAGTVVGQFPHLFPMSLAIGYGVDGLTGARRTMGLWATLGVLAVYFAGIRLVGRTAAAAAAALLAVHILQVWYARYPNSETMMQALLFAALLASDRALVNRDRFFGAVAGWLLGMQIFLRFDGVLALAAVAGAAALGILRRRPLPWTLILPAVALTVLGFLYLATLMTGYSYYPLGFVRDWVLPPLFAASAAALAILLWSARRLERAAWFELIVKWGLIVGAIAAALYAWRFRVPTGRTAVHDALSLRTFAQFYLTPAGLIAALAGYAVVMRRSFTRAPSLMLTLTAFSAFFFYKLRVVPEHFWMGRRFLAVILPGALLLISAVALYGLKHASWLRRALTTALGVAFLGLLGHQYATTARPVVDHVEYAGLIPKVEALAARFGDSDLVIAESRNASASDIHFLALPLAYIYARNVLVLSSPVPDKEVFGVFLAWARGRYERVYFLGGGGTDLLSRRWSATAVASDRFRVPEYETSPWYSFPRSAKQKDFEYGLYELGPPRLDAPPVDLDLGTRDDLYVVRFGAKEETEGRTIRWTEDMSLISLNGFRPESRTVTIWMNAGGRPPSVPPARVHVALEEQPLGTVLVSTGFRAYSFPIPADLAARAAAADPPRLRIMTNPWNPQKALGTGDTRDLGVMIDRVQVR